MIGGHRRLGLLLPLFLALTFSDDPTDGVALPGPAKCHVEVLVIQVHHSKNVHIIKNING